MCKEYEVFGLGGVKLYISKEHRFSADSLLLAEFAGRVADKTICDLCAGCGVIPVALYAGSKKPPKKIYAVEINPEAAGLIRHTAAENNLSFMEVIEGDLRLEKTLTPILRESVDLITANPPYYTVKSGYEKPSKAQKSARYENSCTVKDVVKTAAALLRFGGDLKMCMTAERLTDCVCLMREYKIEPKEIRFIKSGKTNRVRLFLISGKKGANAGVIVKQS